MHERAPDKGTNHGLLTWRERGKACWCEREKKICEKKRTHKVKVNHLVCEKSIINVSERDVKRREEEGEEKMEKRNEEMCATITPTKKYIINNRRVGEEVKRRLREEGRDKSCQNSQ